MEPILQVENLTKQYPNFKLDHVSFSLTKSTIMELFDVGQLCLLCCSPLIVLGWNLVVYKISNVIFAKKDLLY